VLSHVSEGLGAVLCCASCSLSVTVRKHHHLHLLFIYPFFAVRKRVPKYCISHGIDILPYRRYSSPALILSKIFLKRNRLLIFANISAW
jgi:hypothetical protein